ncbi:MAG: response regulator [Candidatus Melainabacteria bacterium]|nr:response regulator [Candidatus Melainabacteria bacterium]
MTTTTGEPISILLIEDNRADFFLLCKKLEQAAYYPYDLEWAEDVATAVERLSEGRFHLVLTDLHLPDSQGLDTLSTVQMYAHHVPIVVLTGMADKALAIQAVRQGAQDYLCKDSLDGDRVASSIRHAIERKKMQEQYLKVKHLESMGVLAGGIAHDFMNFLTTVSMNISLAKMAANCADTVYERLSAAEAAVEQAEKLSQQLLTFARGGAPVRKLSSIGKLYKDASCFFLSGSAVGCEVSVPDDLWLVEVDELQMSQVINNLIANAKDAMPAGGLIRVVGDNVVIPETGLSGHPGLKGGGKYVRLRVIDQGIGIRDEDLQRIFDPFFSTRGLGHGLGLTTTQSIVMQHGGVVGCERNESGIGMTFFVYIPAAESTDSCEQGDEALPAVASNRQNSNVDIKAMPGLISAKAVSRGQTQGKILLMDDQELLRETTRILLQKNEYAVDVASHGAEAIELYKKAKGDSKPYDLVILDLTVPGGMGGKETIQQLRLIDPDVKAIAWSGYSDDAVMSSPKEFGFCAGLPKSHDTQQLFELIQSVMQVAQTVPDVLP